MARDSRHYRKRSRSHSSSSSPERSKQTSSRSREKQRSRSHSRDRDRHKRSRSHERFRRSRSKERVRDRDRERERERERRRRSHSGSRERRRSRSRERERDRERDKEKEREKRRSRSRSKSRIKEKEKKESTVEKPSDDDEPFDPSKLDKEEEQRRLELEMQKRRERIEKWRAERKKKELEQAKKEAEKGTLAANLPLPTKKWTLEDDEDDDDTQENKESKEGDGDDEVDPLDAYMMGVQEEVRKINHIDVRRPGKSVLAAFAAGVESGFGTLTKAGTGGGVPSVPLLPVSASSAAPVPQQQPLTSLAPTQTGNQAKNVVIMTGVAKKKKDEKKKGELMEQNQDAIEYSSEEEEEDLGAAIAGLANKGRKDLVKIDHSSIDYIPFRKSFYVEVPELAKVTPEEVEEMRQELEGIHVKGKGCPKPIRTWPQSGISRKMLECLKKLQYDKPTPIQAQAIPAIMSGRDLIGIAKTGSGKTLAFLLPMFRHIMDQPPLEDTDGPIAVIMTPTRELCMQIGKEAKKFTKSLGIRVVCVYGGTGISEQIAELKRGAEIIVCTPGRMIDMLAANSGRVTNLTRTTYTVLDEADRMFDMGFEPQVMRIIDNIRPDRQTVMFSATFPRQMEALARRILTKPIDVQVGGRSVVCKDVEQHVIVLDEEQKFLKLLELLGHYQNLGSVIVFVDKQEHADILLKELMKASYPCMSLHGGIDQFDRDSTILDFKADKVNLLVATSVAARGLDVKHLILVVNYNCPNHYEDYVHRCGRTGRAGNKGYAYTFVTPDQEKYCGDLIKALELSAVPVPDPLRIQWDRYKAKQAAEGKKVRAGGGFSGKGFKFDEAEAQLANEKKKFQKAALGLQDSDDDDVEQDIDQQIESMLAPKRIVKEIKAPVGGPAPGVPLPATSAAAVAAAAVGGPTPAATDKLELAKKLASRINMAKNLGAEAKGATQQAAEAILKGGGAQPLITAKTVAEQLAAKLNTRLNYQPKEEEERTEEESVETFKKYEEELEINDFPQQARWKVTSKEALAQISEYSEAGITVRGTYYLPGKTPPEGDRKLYLAIESTNELAVSKAKAEITRLLKEELIKLQSSAYHPFNKGRYKVV